MNLGQAIEASTLGTGATEVGICTDKGRVVVRFPEPKLWFSMDPQNALEIGEAIAKEAYFARYGRRIGDGKSALSEKTRQRIVNRMTLMLASLLKDHKPIAYAAAALTDVVLKEVT